MKRFLFVVVISLSVLMGGCTAGTLDSVTPVANQNEGMFKPDTDMNTQYSLVSTDPQVLFDLQIKNAYTILLASFQGEEEVFVEKMGNTRTTYIFSVSRVLKGCFAEKEIKVTISDDIIQCSGALQEGNLYLLSIGYKLNLMLPEIPYDAGTFIIPVREDETLESFRIASIARKELAFPFHTVDEFVTYCTDITDLSKNGPINGWPYTLSEDIDVIIKEAPCVFIGYFSDFYDEYHNKNWSVPFHVTSILKGTIPTNANFDNSSDEHPVFGVFPAYEVENAIENKFYILTGSFSSSDYPSCMVFARRNAIIPMTDTDRVQQVYDALDIQPEP